MGIVDVFWNFFVTLYKLPIILWEAGNDYHSPIYYFGSILFAILIWGISLALIITSTLAIVKKIRWLIRREHCQHCQRWTIGPAGEQFVGCNSNEACCNKCSLEHTAAAETQYTCPVDGSEMTKVINHLNLIIDKCPSCQGVWLSGSELQHMLDDAEEDGEAIGMLTGIAVGIAVN